jgi:hypothetical protein
MRTAGTVLRDLAMVALLCGAALQAAAQSNALVTGSLHETGDLGYDETIVFSCTGMPTCTGTYTNTIRHEGCSNFNTFTGPFTITGLNLTASGPISGTVTFAGLRDSISNPGTTTCILGPVSGSETLSYTGTWNLATSSGTAVVSGTEEDGDPFSIPIAFTANVDAPAPIFPMEVTSVITPTTANASAQIQFRPQDVGRTGSGYVFAYAPRSKVTGLATAKAGEVPKADGDCVLAQLNSAGQLVAMSASQLSAFFSGTLSSQGAAVQILNNVSTPAVSGATFYVGYGSSANAMLDEGVFRDAVLVPGGSACPLLPMQTSLWWNPRESGWGLNLNHQGSTLFGTLFTYDANRAPLWLVMSGGTMQPDGRSFAGDLYRTTGPAFNAQPFTPIGAANVTTVGRMTVLFNDANTASLTYTVNGTQVTKAIQRQVYGSRASNCMPAAGSRATSTNYQDLWWNAAESGWGLNIAHQDNTLFATLFTYDASGRDLWLVMSAGQRQADGSYLGDLYRTSGSAFNAQPFAPIGPGDVTTVGSMRLRISDGENGQLTYTYNGATVTKNITRQVFASPAFACQ